MRGENLPVFVRATGSGTGGIATLLLDGAGAALFLKPFLRTRRGLLPGVYENHNTRGGELIFGRLVNASHEIIDEVIVAPVAKQDSATGNAQIELSCHGGEGALEAVEETLIKAGFARGSGTELLERAHLNGKLSLLAMEARLRLARAVTARQTDFLLGHAALQQHWERLGFEMALGMRSKDVSWREKVFNTAAHALDCAHAGIALLACHRVVIAGPVNAGKSTLVNLLARSEKHIVSEIPGTTRDRLDTPVALNGLHLLLTDTAGVRESVEVVEKEGQQRARQAMQEANLCVTVIDGSRPPAESDLEFISHACAGGRVLLVLNKADLGCNETTHGLGFLTGREACVISANTGAGVEGLEQEIETILLGGKAPSAHTPFTQRQIDLLRGLHAGLQAGADSSELLGCVRKLVGTRPNLDELARVLAE